MMNGTKQAGMLMLGLLVAAVPAAIAGSMVIKGSTTVLPVAQKAAEDFMKQTPGVTISVSGGGSGEGIKAIIDGSCDIATSSRELKEAELSLAKEKNITITTIAIAKDCVVPVVHPSNPLKEISMAQLKDVYTGKIANWKDLGGSDKPIVVISRDTSSGTYEVWNEKVLNKEKVTPEAQLAASNGAIAQSVSKNKYAIGYIGIGYLNKDLKSIVLEGVAATMENALAGKFPVSRDLYFMTRGTPEGEIKQFIDYVLGDAGQRMVREEGFIPLKTNK
jgi:phosphate transport system substrate-binding protein